MSVAVPTLAEVERANHALVEQGPIPLAWIADELPRLREQLLTLANLDADAYTRAKAIFVFGLGLGMQIRQSRESSNG